MTRTLHPGGLVAESTPEDDLVNLSIGDALDVVIEKDVLVSIVMQHAVLAHQPRLGESVYRSADAQILQARGLQRGAEQETARLRRALEHVKQLGAAGRYVAGDALELYAQAALDGGTD